MNFRVLNKHKISAELGELFEFVEEIVDIGKLLQDFIRFCSEESNLNAAWLVRLYFLIMTHTLVFLYVDTSYTA